MTKTKWFALLLLGGLGWASAARDYILETKRLNTGAVAISCKNGGDPTGQKVGMILIISCDTKSSHVIN